MRSLRRFVLVICVITAAMALAQGCHSDVLIKKSSIGGIASLAPASGSVRVCPEASTAVPCNISGVALFSDSSLTKPIQNPVSSDSNGNYSWCAASATYNQQPVGTGLVTKSFGPVTISFQAVPMRAVFSNSGAVLTQSTACGTASRSGLINQITLMTNGLSGNATVDFSTESLTAFLAGTAATSMTNGHPISFTGTRGVQTSTFTGWPTTNIVSGNVYCFALTNPVTIQQLTVLVNFQ